MNAGAFRCFLDMHVGTSPTSRGIHMTTIIKETTVSHTEPMSNRRVCVRGIVYNQGRLLVQELRNSAGEGRGFYCTPGGGVDPKEDIISALQREMVEETGVEPVIGDLLFVQQFADTGAHGEDEQLEFFFAILNPEAYDAIDLATTTHGALEMVSCEFLDPTDINLYPSFLRNCDIESYLAGKHPTFIWNGLTHERAGTISV